MLNISDQPVGLLSSQLYIDPNDGSFFIGHLEKSHKKRYHLVHHKLQYAIRYYSSVKLPDGWLVGISDREASRYYFFPTQGRRRSILVPLPSAAYREIWFNLFKGLWMTGTREAVYLHSVAYPHLMELLNESLVPRVISVEGEWKGEGYIASLEWKPEKPGRLIVTTTLDNAKDHSVPIQWHPIDAVVRLIRK
ncbi:TPA: hypothetical protein ACWLXL_004405 [Pseudomonas aeruginosa]